MFLQIKRGSAVSEEDHRRKEGGDQKDQPEQPGETWFSPLEILRNLCNTVYLPLWVKTHQQTFPKFHNLLPTERATAPERSQHVFAILTKLDQTGRGTKPISPWWTQDKPFHNFVFYSFFVCYPHMSMECLHSSTDSFNLLPKNVLKFKRLTKNLLCNM